MAETSERLEMLRRAVTREMQWLLNGHHNLAAFDYIVDEIMKEEDRLACRSTSK